MKILIIQKHFKTTFIDSNDKKVKDPLVNKNNNVHFKWLENLRLTLIVNVSTNHHKSNWVVLLDEYCQDKTDGPFIL